MFNRYFNDKYNEEMEIRKQEAHSKWIRITYATVVKPGRILIYSTLDELAESIMQDRDGFKNLLMKSAFHYQILLLNKMFRNTGRERAKSFRKNLSRTDDMAEILVLLREIVSQGNLNPDSFKIILHRRILMKYVDGENDSLSRSHLESCWLQIEDFYQMLIGRLNVLVLTPSALDESKVLFSYEMRQM
jgi:hypothetical protein